ncbi:endochitinase A-like [Acanthaster planci]|uniref:Endochitinase A-like n=1 Tax=Acanthaster planci TaxID=133434 RepID=A0A8B7YZB9_ACAPL|nr:endochitinase A-like [Acanthaster planci]
MVPKTLLILAILPSLIMATPLPEDPTSGGHTQETDSDVAEHPVTDGMRDNVTQEQESMNSEGITSAFVSALVTKTVTNEVNSSQQLRIRLNTEAPSVPTAVIPSAANSTNGITNMVTDTVTEESSQVTNVASMTIDMVMERPSEPTSRHEVTSSESYSTPLHTGAIDPTEETESDLEDRITEHLSEIPPMEHLQTLSLQPLEKTVVEQMMTFPADLQETALSHQIQNVTQQALTAGMTDQTLGKTIFNRSHTTLIQATSQTQQLDWNENEGDISQTPIHTSIPASLPTQSRTVDSSQSSTQAQILTQSPTETLIKMLSPTSTTVTQTQSRQALSQNLNLTLASNQTSLPTPAADPIQSPVQTTTESSRTFPTLTPTQITETLTLYDKQSTAQTPFQTREQTPTQSIPQTSPFATPSQSHPTTNDSSLATETERSESNTQVIVQIIVDGAEVGPGYVINGINDNGRIEVHVFVNTLPHQ